MSSTDPKVTEQLAEDLTMAVDAATEPQQILVNIYEADQALVVVGALPAVTADDVDITVAPGRLQIVASMRSAAPKDYLVNEWSYGPYERELEIPEGFGSEVAATLANGQLAIRLLRGDAPADGLTVQPTRP
ncbi:hypothetical protein BH24ACT3_BH24ACT3_07310 [soil metagenome]